MRLQDSVFVGYFSKFGLGLLMVLLPNVMAADWLQWGGPNGDFTVDSKGLAESWAAEGPEQLWKRPLGDGYSAILYKDGFLYTMFSDDQGEAITCLEATTGKSKWVHRYPSRLWPEMGSKPPFGHGPNASPIIVGDFLVSVGISGQMKCLRLDDGKRVWERDLPKEYGRRKRVEEYGYSGNLVRYQDHVIVLVGGDKHAVIAIDPKTGTSVWESEPGGISYAAPRIVSLNGRDQYVYFSPEGVMAIDPKQGVPLWFFPLPWNNGNHLTPVVKCDENLLWVSTQFSSGGGRLLQIPKSGNPTQLWFKSKLRGSCWTLTREGDYIYGSAGGHRVSLMTAFNWKTGEFAWQQRGYHMAQTLAVDGKLLILDQEGKLTLARVSPKGMDVLASAEVSGHVSWTLPTLVGSKLYLRDRTNILALELAAP